MLAWNVHGQVLHGEWTCPVTDLPRVRSVRLKAMADADVAATADAPSTAGHAGDVHGADGVPLKGPLTRDPSLPCKHWKKGKCRFGEGCYFTHAGDTPATTASPQPRSQQPDAAQGDGDVDDVQHLLESMSVSDPEDGAPAAGSSGNEAPKQQKSGGAVHRCTHKHIPYSVHGQRL